jgi:hypothetical protein
MSENDGTYAALMELQQGKVPPKPAASQKPREPAPKPTSGPTEDLVTTPYISQNYRFTEDELRWLRQQAFRLTERLGTKVSQNAILRVALASLRELCDRNPRTNPLVDAISRLKK